MQTLNTDLDTALEAKRADADGNSGSVLLQCLLLSPTVLLSLFPWLQHTNLKHRWHIDGTFHVHSVVYAGAVKLIPDVPLLFCIPLYND